MEVTKFNGQVNFAKIPQELQGLNQWVLLKSVKHNGQTEVTPYSVYNTRASLNDPKSWTSFDNAVSKEDPAEHCGIGFVVTSSDPYCCIRLIGCRDPKTGVVAEWATNEVKRLNSYTEISSNQTDLTVLISSDSHLQKGRWIGGSYVGEFGKASAIEVHTQEHCFELTGRVFKQYQQIEDRQSELQELLKYDFETFSAWDLINSDTPLDPEIVGGLLRVGEVCNIIASTKVGKSWLAIGLAVSVATGREWLGRCTRKGNVLLIDNEVRPATLRNRIATVMQALGIESSEGCARLEVLSLRGEFVDILSLEKALRKYNRDEWVLIILDAKYRAFGELEENSNSDQTRFHNAVDRIARDLNCGFVMIHHTTKGDQGSKTTTDVGSGGGSQSRAVDTHVIIRPHSEEGHAVMDAAVRSFPPVASQSLQWEFPLWRSAEAVEPLLKPDKTRGNSRKASEDLEAIGEITKILHAADRPMTRYEIHKQFGGGKDRVNRLIHLGIKYGRIMKVGTRMARNGEEAETFMVTSRVQPSASSVGEKNGLF